MYYLNNTYILIFIQKMQYTICLNMIVRNESKIIINTLKNILSKIKINYWVISDTGSTDNTKELIVDFFKLENISGELIENEWKDFGHNRTLAIQAAYNKTDYLFIFDADDEIIGDLILPEKCNYDAYEFIFGKDFSYSRVLFANNRKKWLYKGILHEFICTYETCNKTTLFGDYHIVSGRTGYRNLDKDKYLKDALLLCKAYEEEKEDLLKCRYAFYCAQSFKDYHKKGEAIYWYLKCLEINTSNQEKYYSCLMLGNLYFELKNFDNAQKYWFKTLTYDEERIEGIIFLIRKLRLENNNLMINLLYHKHKNYIKPIEKIFLFGDLYIHELEFENILSAYHIHDFESGYLCCKTIIKNSINKNKLYITYNHLLYYNECIKKDTLEECTFLLNKIYKFIQEVDLIENNIIEVLNIIQCRIQIILNEIITNKNKNKIHIINVEYMNDRKENMIKLLKEQNITNYNIIKGIDGLTLNQDKQLYELFKNNTFNYNKYIIGTTLSHVLLWERLIQDKFNEYYIIMEDNITLCKNFNEKLELLKESFITHDIIYLGYHTTNQINTNNINIIQNLNKELYIGGKFIYSINKNGAKKIIEYIKQNNIKYQIDTILLNILNLKHYECNPHLGFSIKENNINDNPLFTD